MQAETASDQQSAIPEKYPAPAARGLGRLDRRWWALVALVVVALIFRLAVVGSYRAPAGDGLQYFKLSHELRAHLRFAYDPPPAPLTFTRLPGYPLFLAFVAQPQLPRSLDAHLIWATRWNALLDVCTGLLVFAILRDRRLGWSAAVCGFLSVLCCPLLVYLSTFGLCESLATFLTTLELWLCLRFADRGELRWAALAGVVAGLSQLVRVDAVTMGPALLLLWAGAKVSWRRRLQAAAAFAFFALLVFAPWPLRNLIQFHHPHPTGTEWVAQDGRPLPTGMMRWFDSWSSASPGESYVLLPLAYNMPLDPQRPGLLQPTMYDDEAERQRIIEIYKRYNRERLSPEVDGMLRALAADRRKKDPVRALLGLPLRRIAAMWKPLPEYELPVRSALLKLPALRARYARFEQGLLLAALLGAIGLCWQAGPGRRGHRLLVAAVALMAVTRSVVICSIHPFPVQRYLAEIFPAILALCGYAISRGIALFSARLRSR